MKVATTIEEDATDDELSDEDKRSSSPPPKPHTDKTDDVFAGPKTDQKKVSYCSYTKILELILNSILIQI